MLKASVTHGFRAVKQSIITQRYAMMCISLMVAWFGYYLLSQTVMEVLTGAYFQVLFHQSETLLKILSIILLSLTPFWLLAVTCLPERNNNIEDAG